ncbi:hypothetical protein JMN32_09385 [Fulvivirga sp. 29W222]|uniref:DUF4412 domain-containing protein n=1 Tax=Fulvivirga marina TaxID=2494733 RepID=A0A937KB74_9BACT|nr:hypothetical protein [Fulvivirga marina]MBL6446521.1 hypothetical protein [Fulvivirga marina]
MIMVLNKRVLFLTILSVCMTVMAYGQKTHLPEPYINHAENGLIYNTVFAYKEYSFSGLMVVKKEGEAYRVVLLSKLGPSIMDFVLENGELIWNKVPKGMERAVIRKIMARDFSIMLLTDLQNPDKVRKRKDGYKVKGAGIIKVKLANNNDVREAETKNTFTFFKTKASFFYTNDDHIPDEICVNHRYIKMKMEMKLLER